MFQSARSLGFALAAVLVLMQTPAQGRTETLRTLALNTDGIALVNGNDLSKQIRRVADDLTSYYLMGYYSTNGKLDGRFRTINVRSKRPGITLAPLGPGDYVVELITPKDTSQHKTLVAFRVTP